MFKPVKSLGQNFLVDKSIVGSMLDSLDIVDGDRIIEIGPGHGALTEELVAKIRDTHINVLAIEIDERFANKLHTMYSDLPNIYIYTADFLQWYKDYKPEKDYKVLGSLPYYITSPILHSVVKAYRLPTLCVFMVQAEVADKLILSAPDASYLSVFMQTFFTIHKVIDVPNYKFEPQPGVESAVIKLVKKANIEIKAEEIERYEGFLHRGFQHPRKMLNKVFTKEELDKVGVSGNLRAQNLEVTDWIRFFRTMYNRETQ